MTSKDHLKHIGLIVTSLAAISAHAQVLDGCVNSPENPTLALGMIGLVAAVVPLVKNKAKQRRQRHEKNEGQFK